MDPTFKIFIMILSINWHMIYKNCEHNNILITCRGCYHIIMCIYTWKPIVRFAIISFFFESMLNVLIESMEPNFSASVQRIKVFFSQSNVGFYFVYYLYYTFAIFFNSRNHNESSDQAQPGYYINIIKTIIICMYVRSLIWNIFIVVFGWGGGL